MVDDPIRLMTKCMGVNTFTIKCYLSSRIVTVTYAVDKVVGECREVARRGLSGTNTVESGTSLRWSPLYKSTYSLRSYMSALVVVVQNQHIAYARTSQRCAPLHKATYSVRLY